MIQQKGGHPCIVGCIDVLYHDRHVLIVMERLGPSLAKVVRDSGRLELKLCLQYLPQIINGLCFLHYQGTPALCTDKIGTQQSV